MQKIKQGLRSVKNGLQIINDYGMDSFKKRLANKRFHQPPNMDVMKKAHLVSEEELNKQRARVFEQGCKFSIITPLYNTPKDFLEELLESLKVQTYGNWELCLADGSDKDHTYVGDICKAWAKEEPRIAYHVLEENKGISENTNECIKLATGDYFGLLDHDDLLHPSALYEVMAAIEETGADFLYTDEVKFSGNVENISDPLAFNLKPGFGKFDLRSHNYICHFTVFSKSLLEGEEEFYRPAFDGSQDHDMVLRLTEKARCVVHVPKVLYYWRVHSNSVSMDLSTKLYAVDAAIHAISEQLERNNEKGTVQSNLPFQTIYRVSYELIGHPFVSVLIPKGGTDKRKIMNHTTYKPIEVLYVEDDWNEAIKEAKGEYIILLDKQCVPISEQWIEEMLMYAQRDDVCAVAPKIYYPDDTICYAGISLDWKKKDKIKFLCSHDTRADIGYEALMCHVRHTTATLSLCMMFAKKTWEELGGFDGDVKGYEDIDFCLRGIETGKNNVWTCFAEMRYQGKSLEEKTEEQIRAFADKWQDRMQEERYYHPMWEILKLV